MNLLQRIDLANLGTWVKCSVELPTVKGEYLTKDSNDNLHMLGFTTHDQGFTKLIPNPTWHPDSLSEPTLDEGGNVMLTEDPVEWLKLD